MIHTHGFFLVLAAMFLSVGCGPSLPSSKGLAYIALSRTPIGVSRVSVSVSPWVQEDHPLAPVPLSVMVKQWAADSWQITGGPYELVFCIKEIHMTEEQIPCTFSPKNWANVRDSDVYRGKMTLSCQLRSPNGRLVGQSDIVLRHERHVPENYTLIQRKALWNQVCEALINQLTIEAKSHIPEIILRTNGAPL